MQLAADLRDPDEGCPWDVEQTHESVIENMIEEAYEAVDAIEHLNETQPDTINDLKEELGDVLFQVVFHAQMASEKQWFDLIDVIQTITTKLISRHPHVYEETDELTSPQVLKNWEATKRRERQKKDPHLSMLSGVPARLPALLRSYRIGNKVAKVKFDWPKGKPGTEMLEAKVLEEFNELKQELPDNPESFAEKNINESKALKQQKDRAQEEFGDLFFAMAQLARRYHIDPEQALQKANNKFSKRFTFIEAHFKNRLNSSDYPSLTEWEEQWQRAKNQKLR